MEGVDILEKTRKLETGDNEVIKVVEEMKKVGVKILRDKEWREKNIMTCLWEDMENSERQQRW